MGPGTSQQIMPVWQHADPQQASGAWHVELHSGAMQVPFEQTGVSLVQTLPQAPQWFGSSLVFTQ
jgi:hypothetical protein